MSLPALFIPSFVAESPDNKLDTIELIFIWSTTTISVAFRHHLESLRKTTKLSVMTIR
jgi:hypothetical protein